MRGPSADENGNAATPYPSATTALTFTTARPPLYKFIFDGSSSRTPGVAPIFGADPLRPVGRDIIAIPFTCE